MAKQKQQGPRGARGIPGPPGPRELPAPTAIRGHRQGRRHRSDRTHRDTRAKRGDRCSGVRQRRSKGRKRLIAAVDRHIENIYGELTAQMRRMARIQAQVDELRAKIRNAL